MASRGRMISDGLTQKATRSIVQRMSRPAFRALAAWIAASSIAACVAVALHAQGQLASLAGTASTNTGQTLVNVTVQLRNLATGQLVGSTTTTATGSFSFAGIQAGQYAVEVVNTVGQV